MANPSEEESPLLTLAKADLLSCITRFLNAADIAKLYLCGNFKLIAMMKHGGVRALVFQWPPEPKYGVVFPDLIAQFSELEEFQFLTCMTNTSLIYNFDIDLVKKLPKTIRTLRLKCKRAESAFAYYENYPPIFNSREHISPTGYLNFTEHFPNLTTLEVMEYIGPGNYKSCALSGQMLLSLPSMITSLTVSARSDWTDDIVKTFPRNLTYLKIRGCAHLASASLADLPPGLTSLLMSKIFQEVIPEHLSYLPRSIRNLKMCLKVPPQGFALLPPLTCFTIKSCLDNYRSITTDHISFLPPSVELFRMQMLDFVNPTTPYQLPRPNLTIVLIMDSWWDSETSRYKTLTSVIYPESKATEPPW